MFSINETLRFVHFLNIRDNYIHKVNSWQHRDVDRVGSTDSWMGGIIA